MSPDIDIQDHGPSAPTQTSSALSLVVGLAVIGLLVWQVDLALAPVLVGSAGAVCLAAGLWLVGHDRGNATGRILAGLLSLPVSLGLFTAILGGGLVLATASLPVRSASALSLLSLTVVTQVGVIAGCVFGVLGIALGVRNTVDEETLSTQFWVTIQTAIVPSLAAMSLAVGAVLAQQESNAVAPSLVDGLVRWLLAPGRLGTHLATALGLVTVAAVAVRAAVGALPLAEVFGDSGTGEATHDHVSQLQKTLGLLAFGTGVLSLVAFVVEVTVSATRLQQLLGYGLYRTLASLSTAPGLRSLTAFLVVASVATWLVVYVLRQMATNSGGSVLYRTGPLAGGVCLTLGSFAFGRSIVEAVIAEIGLRLPDPFDGVFYESARSVVDAFGAPTLVLIGATFLLAATAGLLIVVRLAVFAGYLSAETAGYSLASGGLFVAAAFAGTLVTEAWVLFAALVGSFFVWDMGHYGTTMAHEIGRQASTRDAELVHAGGTLGVGLLGVGAAYAIQRLLASGTVAATPTAVVALVGVLVGIVFLVTALR